MSVRQRSTDVNKDVLKYNLGLKQLSNTSIFLKDDIFVLSPSMQNAHNWFDLRKVNLNRFKEKPQKGFLLIRYFDTFLVADLSAFSKQMMPSDKFVFTKTIGEHWKFNILLSGNKYSIVNQQNRRVSYSVEEVSINRLQDLIK